MTLTKAQQRRQTRIIDAEIERDQAMECHEFDKGPVPVGRKGDTRATKTAHTPGPWGVRYAHNVTVITTLKGEMHVSLHGRYDGLKPLYVSVQEWQANARLIAAAPELLAALENAVIRLIQDDENNPPDIGQMQAALAKVRP